MKLISKILILSCAFMATQAAFAATLENSPQETKQVSSLQQNQLRAGCSSMRFKEWETAIERFETLSTAFPDCEEGQAALYYNAICYYNMGEFDIANEYFSNYLQSPFSREYFESAVQYKLAIANKFSRGAKRRFFGHKMLPKVLSGEELALEIYDQVIVTLPCHDLAARALYQKAQLYAQRNCYFESIDTYQQLIRRFPKHELAPESYLNISHLYLEQCCKEVHNSDLLAFAQINLKKFQQDFPREDRLCQAEENLLAMKELYASALYETGEFYVRKGHPAASLIYYQNVIDRFPETAIANDCRSKLSYYRKLKPNV